MKLTTNRNAADCIAEAVYGTLYGLYLPEDEIPGVENLFMPGSLCDRVENEAGRLREQLEDRLNIQDYELVEQLVTQLYCIQKEMCLHMFYYGEKFGRESRLAGDS